MLNRIINNKYFTIRDRGEMALTMLIQSRLFSKIIFTLSEIWKIHVIGNYGLKGSMIRAISKQ